MQIEISPRHGELDKEQHAYILEKAEKLLKYFQRVMAIRVVVDQAKNEWQVEINLSTEHKHDFVAHDHGPTPEKAMDHCLHKMEEQLRRYKERVQNHKGETPQGGTGPNNIDLPAPPDA